MLGGANSDSAVDWTVDAAGNLYLVGTSYSALPTTANAALPASPAGGPFAAKLRADGSTFLYLTYLPAAMAAPAAIRVDARGNAYLSGLNSGSQPVVTELSGDGSAFLYTTVLNGTAANSPAPVLAVDGAGNVAITGQADSPNFPVTAGVAQPLSAGSQNAFITKLDSAGNIVFSTYLGGNGGASSETIRMDSAGDIYIGGSAGAGFPTTAGAYEPTAVVPLWSAGGNGFVAKLKGDGTAIMWATYLELNGVPYLAVNSAGEVYLASGAGAVLVMTASAPQPCFGGNGDVVVMHLDAHGDLLDATYFGADQADGGGGMTLPGDGLVLVTASMGNGGVVLAQIRFGGPGWSAPACMSPDVVNAATFVSQMVAAPGEFVSLTGFGIGPEIGVSYQPGAQGQAPFTLGGVQVSFNGVAAPLLYVQSRQVNTQIPFEAIGDTISVTLTYNGATFGPFSMQARLGMPGIFRLQPGVSTQAAAFNQDNTVNGAANPAAPGSVVYFYATGFGPLSPPCVTGTLNPDGPAPLLYAAVGINGVNAQSPALPYIGGAPTMLCGIVQINMQVPLDAGPGPFPMAPAFATQSMVGSTIVVQ